MLSLYSILYHVISFFPVRMTAVLSLHDFIRVNLSETVNISTCEDALKLKIYRHVMM